MSREEEGGSLERDNRKTPILRKSQLIGPFLASLNCITIVGIRSLRGQFLTSRSMTLSMCGPSTNRLQHCRKIEKFPISTAASVIDALFRTMIHFCQSLATTNRYLTATAKHYYNVTNSLYYTNTF